MNRSAGVDRSVDQKTSFAGSAHQVVGHPDDEHHISKVRAASPLRRYPLEMREVIA
jgi:hypothetical protein